MRLKHSVRMIKDALHFDIDGTIQKSYVNSVGRHFGQQLVDKIAPRITPYRDSAPFVQGYEFTLDLEVLRPEEFEKLMADHWQVAYAQGLKEGQRFGAEATKKRIMVNLLREDIVIKD